MARPHIITFVVPGKPIGKGRPRFSRSGHAYTPDQTKRAEMEVARRASDAMVEAGRDPVEGPCCVHLVARWPIPGSWSKAKREAALCQEITPGKPDLDNIAKLILDAMNGVVYQDDAQVVVLSVTKCYSDDPGVTVIVTE